jgi:hypothetical protein
MAVKKANATSKSVSTKPVSSKQVPSPKGRLAKATKSASDDAAGEKEVTMDRRRNGRREEAELTVAPAKLERRTKVQRRRQIDPTTCERDYSDEEVGFMNAMDEYKRTSGRMFPTCSEVLEVIRGLGYVKLTPAEIAVIRPEGLNPVETSEIVDSENEDEEAEFELESV